MGELIRREAAAKPLDFSGERLTAAISGQVEVEHYHRYLLARDYCAGKDVLDCAAGEGYGTALLSQVARSAIGVEIDAASVAAARAEFSYANLRFEQGDARALPLPDACVDVAVSFETLEHLVEQDQFLSELHRVLRPGGLLIISTPDRDVYSPLGSQPNPYHRLELTRAEFGQLLARHFGHAAMAGQRAMIGSVILGGGQSEPARTFERRGDGHIEASNDLARAMYLIAFASDAALPVLRNTLYVYRSDLDTDPQVRRQAELGLRAAQQALQATDARAAEKLDRARQQLDELQRQFAAAEHHMQAGQAREAHAASVITNLEREMALLQAAVERLQHDKAAAIARNEALEQHFHGAQARASQAEHALAETAGRLAAEASAHTELRAAASALSQRLAAIEASSIWRMSYPARRLGSRFPRAARLLRLISKLAWWALTLQLASRLRLRREHRALLLQPAPPPLPIAAPLSPIAGLSLPHAPEPDVSIVICTYGLLDTTLACLRSIAAHPPAATLEVIVVDDAYPGPQDMSVLRDIPGLLLLRNAGNLGFLRSCNKAARVARGRYIHMLNNDTELLPGSIDTLVELLDARPDAGMAGSKLLFPDGTLQEAGGILWTDATGWNYGRGQDPARPEFNYLREADYISGASIMIRRTVFEALGGFDEDFAPAYYEDADLAFRIRAHGLKVLYEPRSAVIHHEGMSHGTDTAAGVKAHQVVNQARMLARWGDTLAREHYPSGQHVLRARDRSRTRTVMLVLEHYALEPDRDAGSRSTMGILDSLIAAGWVVKFWPLNRRYSAVYTTAMQRRGIEVIDERAPGDLEAWMRANGAELDHVLVVRPDTAAMTLHAIMAHTTAKLSFYGVDLHGARVRRQAELEGNAALLREAEMLDRLEQRVWRNFDLVIYPSEAEAAEVRAHAPGILARGIVPFCFEASPPRTAPVQARSLLFVAGFAHPPNVDAALFLMNEVLPKLEAIVGPLTVTLAGSNPTEQIRQLAGRDVTVTGYVTDEVLAGLYASHRASVVPLRFGAGVKGKVVESLSRGLPLVTTPTGAQGIAGLDKVVPVREDAGDLAAALATLLTGDDAWMRQSHAQTAFATDHFSPAAMQRSVIAAFAALDGT